MNNKIKLVAFDLDDTLLDSEKNLSDYNKKILYKLNDKGIYIVPTTGRYYKAIPDILRTLPFIKYAITINGANIYDMENNKTLYEKSISHNDAIAIMKMFDNYPILYDFFEVNAGYMNASHMEKIDEYAISPAVAKMYKTYRETVVDIQDMITKNESIKVQKIQGIYKDMDLRDKMFDALKEKFPNVTASSAMRNNMEITHKDAKKGTALKILADALHIDIKETMAIGDGTNDISMIKTAGIGVAMENARKELIDVADYVTKDCNQNGAGLAMEKFILSQ